MLALSRGILAAICPVLAVRAEPRLSESDARASGSPPPTQSREVARLKARATSLRKELKLNRRAQARAKGEPLELLRAKEDELALQLDEITRRLRDVAPS